jgi:hypothetical protein
MGTAAWHKTTSPTPLQLATPLRLVLLFSSFLVPSSASAQVTFPVSVPTECAALAVREGFGTVINSRYQAAKAKAKLYRLNGRDPEVAQCRQAVQRLQEASRSRDTMRSQEAARDKFPLPVAEQARPDVH